MSSARLLVRAARGAGPRLARPLHTSLPVRNVNDRKHDRQEEYERIQKQKPLNPHMTNTNSTIANQMPAAGKDSVPPELITSVDGDFTPKDSIPDNTSRMTGGSQDANPASGVNSDLDVGEIEGGSFRVEPLRRSGEDTATIKARLIYQSRKRGTLESDLLLSTFADANLDSMTLDQLQQYDLFLDENDWDIYYWVTQEPTPTSQEYAEGGAPALANKSMQGKNMPASPPVNDVQAREPASGEWAQTVGTFKAAYRPVPKRWKNSEILAMLRKHVIERSAGGLHIQGSAKAKANDAKSGENRSSGLGFMPQLR